MSIFLLFRTKKETQRTNADTEFIGQAGDNSIPKVSAITKKVTGEPVTNIAKKSGSRTGITKNYLVDFVDKDAFKGGQIPE